MPPHSKALISRLKSISDEWLSRGRSERGFVMGYFTEECTNQCDIFVERDQGRTIQAFINIVPANWDKEEGIVPKTMGLVYSNIDRMYSFSGLYRFKNKYEPNWRERYIAYKGGIRGFTKVMNALIKTMKKTAKPNGFKRSRLFRK